MTRWKVWKSNFNLNVANSFTQSRRIDEPSRVYSSHNTRREGEREKSSFSLSPSQSGVSDSRSAASTPTVGTLTLQILIRQLRETRLLTLHASAYLNFSNTRAFLGFLFTLGLHLLTLHISPLIKNASIHSIFYNLFLRFFIACLLRIYVRQSAKKDH